MGIEKGKLLYNAFRTERKKSKEKKRMLDAAIEEYKAALRIDADSAKAHYNLGNAFLKKGMLDEARKEYEEALRIDPSYANARFNLETVLFEIALRDTEKREVVGRSDSPEDSTAHFNLGYAYKTQGNIELAIREYKEAIKLNPRNAKAHNNLGNVYATKGMYEDAVKEYEEALRIDPNHINARLNIENARKTVLVSGKKGEIAERKDEEKIREHIRKGISFAEKGVWDGAIKEYKEAVRIDPNNFVAQYNLGFIFLKKGIADEAIEPFRNALRINPNYAEAHSNLGQALAAKGMLDEAIEEYKNALALNPNLAATHYNLGNAYVKKGLIDEAIKEYKEALRITPDIAEVHNNLGTAFGKKGKQDEAIKEHKEALRLNPKFADALYNLGLALAMKGLMNEAVVEFKKTLRIDPNHRDARIGLEYALKRRGTGNKIQKLPKDLEREYEEFLGKKKGIKLDIVSVHDLPQQSIILLKPDRKLSSEERTLRPYIKAKLLCEMPRAISSLNNKDLILIRTTPALVTSADRKEFHQPGWTVKWRGHTIGPLSFMMDWDEDEQLFLAGLYEIAFKIRRVVSKEYQNQEFSVIKQIARAYRDEIKRIEI